MKKEAILHIPLSQYAYATGENDLTIRIRTGKDDVDKCTVFYGDRVAVTEPIPVLGVEMKKCASDELFDYYGAEIHTEHSRVCYYFSLEAQGERCFYYSRGFCDKMYAHRTEYFQFPYIRREEIVREPEWLAGSVMYHIFPDSFASGKRQLSLSHGGANRSENRLGGTLRGITENLDYLCDLGVNLLYLNPIFKAGSYHKYDTEDYFEIDPCFGTKEDFHTLVDCVHERGMRIILDGVFNHCGPDFFAFRDVLKNGEASKYKDWFYQLAFPLEYKDPPNYESFAYVKEMPKLNTGNEEVRDYICDVGKYWVREFGIDGWRLDVANEVDHDTWRAFRKAVRQENPEAFLIAEIWEDADVWLKGDQFDSAMNYTFSYLCRDFFAYQRISAQEFDEQMQKAMMRYPWTVTRAQMNFLDSHDVPRFLYYCDGDRRKLELAFFYLMMSPGIPSVFYGDECFITGKEEEEYRSAMPWGQEDSEFSKKIRKWIGLRKAHPALTDGRYEGVYASEGGGYVFSRVCNEEKLYIVINNSEKEMALPGLGNVNLDGEIFDLSGGTNLRTVEPYGGLVIKRK